MKKHTSPNTTKMNMEKKLAMLEAFMDHPSPRVPLVLLLDNSISMAGAKIRRLKEGLDGFIQFLVNDPEICRAADISIITFNSTTDVVIDFTSADQIAPFTLSTAGMTHLGEALDIALAKLLERKEFYKSLAVQYGQPILVVLTDGQGNGDAAVFADTSTKIRSLTKENKMVFVPVSVGDDTDIEELTSISGTPPRSISDCEFDKFFRYLSSSIEEIVKNKDDTPEEVLEKNWINPV